MSVFERLSSEDLELRQEFSVIVLEEQCGVVFLARLMQLSGLCLS